MFSVQVTGVNGMQVHEQWIAEGGDISQAVVDADQVRFRAQPLWSGVALVELAPYLQAPALAAPRPLPSAASGYPVGRLLWDIQLAAGESEQLVTPAGTFDTLRVRVTGRAQPMGETTAALAATPARFEYLVWYSPSVQRYVQSRHRTWNRFETLLGDELVRLVAYEKAN